MRPIVAHVQHGDWFHVMFGVAIREYEAHFDDRTLRVADLMLFYRGNIFYEFGLQHFNSLISACYWVSVPELHLLETDVRRDHERRGLGKEQINELEQIKQQLRSAAQ